MRAKSIKGRSPEEILSVLNKSMADGFRPTLAVVFLSISQDRKMITEILDAAGIAVYGATTNGEFIDEEIEKGSAAILLLEIKKDRFRVYFGEYTERNYRETARLIAKKAKELFTRPSFLIAASHMETDAEQLLFGFEDVCGKDVNVFGGMAGDDYKFSEQFVFTNGKESNRGIVVNCS